MKIDDLPTRSTLTSRDACAALGISRDTLYAYVSRGHILAIAHPADSRRSLYDGRDIEALLARKTRGRSRKAVAQSTINWGEPVLESKITRILDGQFTYRGKNAVDLSRRLTLEDTLSLLAQLKRSTRTQKTVRITKFKPSRPFDRIVRLMAQLATSNSPNKGRPAAARILRSAALAGADQSADDGSDIHLLLARSWSTHPRAADLIRRALVLCADHELNASTYAARVAASAGASLPAALLAGLATLSGTGHGGLTTLSGAWIDAVEKSAAPRPDTKIPPGFGHPLYPDGDPRAAELLSQCGLSAYWTRCIDTIHEQTGLRPGLDFSLATLERQLALPKGAGLAVFAIGRIAGWSAHVFEQRETGKLIRPRASA